LARQRKGAPSAVPNPPNWPDAVSGPQADRAQAGFTLVEMLVALVLLGMLGATILLSYRTIVPSWRRVQARIDSDSEFDVAASRFKDLVSQSYPAVIGGPGTPRRIDFAGAPQRIEFLAPLVRRFGASVMARYALYQSSDATLRLTSQLDFASPDRDPGETKPEAVLLSGPTAVTFDYFGAEKPSSTPSWQPTWIDRRTLPLLVRMRFASPTRVSHKWPAVIVAPLVSASADCAFDPVDGKCRGQ
jgi:general secretion pathway protein J